VALERLPAAEFRGRLQAAGGPELDTLAGMLRRLPNGLDRLLVDNPALFRADAGVALAARAGIGPPDLDRAMRGYVSGLVARAEEAACASV
jgi:hypothetical protein